MGRIMESEWRHGIFPSAEDVNRPPIADAGGPYQGVAGVAVAFDGTGSSDPDAYALTYAWNFGDDGDGCGGHDLAHVRGRRAVSVSLTVTGWVGSRESRGDPGFDPDALAAQAYAPAGQTAIRLAHRSLSTPSRSSRGRRLRSGRRRSELASGWLLRTGSVTEIGPVLGKTAVVSDRDRNGVPRSRHPSEAGLAAIVDGLAPGQHDVTVVLEGKVSSGARFTTSLGLRGES